MNCDRCNGLIGNTLYELGSEGTPNYERLCPICWLGKEEGSKPKYQQFEAAWTVSKLKAFKTKPWRIDRKDAANWWFSHDEAKWIRKKVVINGDPF